MHTLPAAPIDNASGQMVAPLLLCDEDQARADFYALIAHLLFAPPERALLAALAAADPILAEHGALPLGTAWESLVLASSVVDEAAVAEEFDALFISTGTPPVNPYGSLYMCGYMNDKPLAALRADLVRLRLGRAPGAAEMEDHLGALCETMRVLIAGGEGALPRPVAQQRQFFDKHILPWHARCLDDIGNASGANYYKLVARFAAAFLTIEAEAFAVAQDSSDP